MLFYYIFISFQVALKHLDYQVQLEVKLSRLKGDLGNFHGLRLSDILVY